MPIAAALLTFGTVFSMLNIEYLSTMSARTRLNWPAPSEIGLLTNLGKWYFRAANHFCNAGSACQFFTQHGTVVFEASFNTLTGIPSEALAKLSRLGELVVETSSAITTLGITQHYLTFFLLEVLHLIDNDIGTVPTEIGLLSALRKYCCR